MRTRPALYTTAFLRAVSTGAAGVLLGVHLARLGLDPESIGVVVGSGLAGAAVAAGVATTHGDRLGRRRLLVAVATLGTVGTFAFVAARSLPLLALFSFLGMLNGMGRDRGAGPILEQAALPATTTDEGRTRTLAWYTMLQDVGHGIGALLAGIPTLLVRTGWQEVRATGATLAGAALVGLATVIFYAAADTDLEPRRAARRPTVTRKTRRVLVRISSLFAVDSLAGGFLTTSLLSYFFFERFGVAESALGALFFAARVLNAFSHLAAARLARSFGLVPTMVFTHVPSSLLLVTVAFAPSFLVAATFFLLREGLVEMDVPTRQSYVLAVVTPEERTLASGVTNLVRLCGWALGPLLAGLVMAPGSLYPPLLVGAGMKIAYDFLLWRSFRHLPPPEERSSLPHGVR